MKYEVHKLDEPQVNNIGLTFCQMQQITRMDVHLALDLIEKIQRSVWGRTCNDFIISTIQLIKDEKQQTQLWPESSPDSMESDFNDQTADIWLSIFKTM
jgi:hypothetical protein